MDGWEPRSKQLYFYGMTDFIKRISKYWMFQALGWGLFVAVNLFFAISYKMVDQTYFIRLLVTMLLGLIFSDLMRTLIKKIKLLKQRINVQLFGFVMLSIVFALTVGLIETVIVKYFDLNFSCIKVVAQARIRILVYIIV